MYRGTTPTIENIIRIDETLTDFQDIWVTFRNTNKVLTLKLSQGRVTIEETETEDGTWIRKAIVTLTQEETLKFPVGDVDVQIKLLKVLESGEPMVLPTKLRRLKVEPIINEDIMEVPIT